MINIALYSHLQTGTADISEISIIYDDRDKLGLIKKIKVVENDNELGQMLANTGLAYDLTRNIFYVSQFCDSLVNINFNKILIYDRDFNLVGEIPCRIVYKIQGITYDWDNDQIIVWGWNRNDEVISMEFINAETHAYIRHYATVIHSPGIPGTMAYSGNGLMYVNEHAAWNIFKRRSTDYSSFGADISTSLQSESIAIDPFDDTILWTVYGNDLYKFSKSGSQLQVISDVVPTSGPSFEEEGLIVDPVDRTFWLNADEYFHGSIDGGNRINHFDALGTWDKNLKFPEMFPINTENGIFTSPVIDFNDNLLHKNLENWQITGTYNKIQFRGSNSAPNTTFKNRFGRPIYSGWGSIPAGNWQNTVPNYRYIQFKIL